MGSGRPRAIRSPSALLISGVRLDLSVSESFLLFARISRAEVSTGPGVADATANAHASRSARIADLDARVRGEVIGVMVCAEGAKGAKGCAFDPREVVNSYPSTI